jgi:hypothetical protein
MIDIGQARLRSNPKFRLVPFDLLPAQELEALRELKQTPDFYGILVPPEGSVLPVKSVSRDAALLFMTLREPACLPHLLNDLFGADVAERLRPLILDGVFEIEEAGRFVSGPSALTRIEEAREAASSSRVPGLCEDAISYAAALDGVNLRDLAARLYLFNVAPAGSELYARFARDDRLVEFLFEGSDGARRLQSRWHRETLGDAWFMWRSAVSAEAASYKLYVSPNLEHLPHVFDAALRAFAAVRCRCFKVGRGAFGVLRPDKLVAYFSTLDSLQQAAEEILGSVAGATAQGVPFTAPIDADGLLSWGMDPPRFEQVLASQQIQSWRQWLTGRIAIYVLAAKEAGTDPHSFVRNRVELDGVDPSNWSPDLAIWRGPLGSVQEVA